MSNVFDQFQLRPLEMIAKRGVAQRQQFLRAGCDDHLGFLPAARGCSAKRQMIGLQPMAGNLWLWSTLAFLVFVLAVIWWIN
ncbi:MAG: hypothetical protein IT445_19150 [Phycisphaeraceae bacterium]|nr:hypothetical protein [Phycisphaeraceae bacterium]